MFLLTKEQEKLKRELQEFVDYEILPVATELDIRGGFPHELFSRIGKMGYLDAEFEYIGSGAKGPALITAEDAAKSKVSSPDLRSTCKFLILPSRAIAKDTNADNVLPAGRRFSHSIQREFLTWVMYQG